MLLYALFNQHATCFLSPSTFHPTPIYNIRTRSLSYTIFAAPSNYLYLPYIYGVVVCTPGWFNSLAGVVKRRFASYVKLHLTPGTGDGTPSATGGGRERPRGAARNGFEIAKPHYRSSSANAAVSQYGFNAAAARASPRSMENGGADSSGATSKMQAPSPHVLGGGNDRRHRSPDPPPRLVERY